MATEGFSYFYMNGHNFIIETDAESTSELNIKENTMFVPSESYGYTDLQWCNFTGEELPLVVYSRITDEYTGDKVQPTDGTGDENFYNGILTPHSVLKYWAQKGIPVKVRTNIESLENGTYLIMEHSQSNPTFDWVVTNLTLKQYEKPEDVIQTYYAPTHPEQITSVYTLTATATEIRNIQECSQTCNCTEDSDPELCIAPADDNVAVLQKYLRRYGYLPIFTRAYGRINITGRYCYYTTQAVKELQADFGLTINGNCNSEVKKALEKLSLIE